MTLRPSISLLPVLVLAVLAPPTGSPPTASEDASWAVLPQSPDAGRARHDDVFFATDLTGWLVNTRGEIWKTTDGGDNWSMKLKKGSEAKFRSVGFANDLLGWSGTVQSPQNLLYETQDGGETWTNISSRIAGPMPSGICGISVVTEEVAYGVGAFFGEPYLIKTTDGGVTWRSTSLAGTIATMIDVHFFDVQNGIAVGGSGESLNGDAVIIRTSDGGETWQEAYRSTRDSGIRGEWGWKISFPTRQTGFVSVEYYSNSDHHGAKVLKTVDGGISWTATSISGSTEPAGLQGIGFVTPDIGWASGRGTTSLTTDGGTTWTQLVPYSTTDTMGQLDGRVNRIRVVNDSLAFAIGARVYRLSGRFDSTSEVLSAPQSPRLFELAQNYPNPFESSTKIDYRLLESASVRVTVHDLNGRLIRTLHDAIEPAGDYTLDWNGLTDAGTGAAAGVYLYLIDVGDAQEMKRMVLLR